MKIEEVKAPVDNASKSYKNFRSYDEVEKLYRFIHENDLKRECVKVLEKIKLLTKKRKTRKPRKSRKVLH